MLMRDEWIEQLEKANGDIAKTQFFQSLTEKSYHWIAENFQNLSELHKERKAETSKRRLQKSVIGLILSFAGF